MNRIFVSIGPLTIYYYSLLILIAVIIGYFIADKYNKKLNMPTNLITDMILGIVISALLGARIYYVIFNFSSYQDNILDIFKIWEGGLAIYGAIVGGIIYLFQYCQKYKQPFIKLCDICSLSLLLGQAIGRWGNFINQEAYGPITTMNHLKQLHLPNFIIEGMYIENAYRTPTFLYESLWCLLGVLILFFIRKMKPYTQGRQLSFYLIWYGLGRYVIEGLRTDSLYIGHIKISQVVSILIIMIGLFINYQATTKRKKLLTRGGEDEKL